MTKDQALGSSSNGTRSPSSDASVQARSQKDHLVARLDLSAAPAWLRIAYAELGQQRFPQGTSNPRIDLYNCATALKGYDDKISWCSSFVNWCLAQVGIEGTSSALARSWLQWGVALVHPTPGCITVVARESLTSWKGHVGFFIEGKGDDVILLGGNQDDTVKLKAYPRREVLGFRLPEAWSEATIP